MEDLVAEVVDNTSHALLAVQGPTVVHRRQDAIDLQSRVKAVTDLVYGLHQQRDAPHREELTLQRDDHAVGRGQRIDGEQTQRGLTVDQDHVVVVPSWTTTT